MILKCRSRIVLYVGLGILVNCSIAYARYSGGTGTKPDPYRISNKQDLLELAINVADCNRHFVLTADIDLAGEEFNKAVIAPDNQTSGEVYDGKEFTGSFDGKSHKIMNLKIKSPSNDFLGLFGAIGSDGIVFDLCVENGEIIGGNSGCHGILCGSLIFGTVKNCYTTGSVVSSSNSTGIGGLCGASEKGVIDSCYSTASVTAGNNYIGIGGLCGGKFEGSIKNSYSSGLIVTGTGCNQIGGLCGANEDGTIENCFANSSISGGKKTRYAGGFVGGTMKGNIQNSYSNSSVKVGEESICLGGFCGAVIDGKISNCYSTGGVAATNPYRYLGGFSGGNKSGVVTSCFWDTQSSRVTSSSGGKGLATAELKDKATWDSAGWDFADDTEKNKEGVWYLKAKSYPVLTWQLKKRDVKDDGTEASPGSGKRPERGGLEQTGQEDESKKKYAELLSEMTNTMMNLQNALTETQKTLDDTRKELIEARKLAAEQTKEIYELMVMLEHLKARHRRLLEEKANIEAGLQ